MGEDVEVDGAVREIEQMYWINIHDRTDPSCLHSIGCHKRSPLASARLLGGGGTALGKGRNRPTS